MLLGFFREKKKEEREETAYTPYAQWGEKEWGACVMWHDEVVPKCWCKNKIIDWWSVHSYSRAKLWLSSWI